MVGSYKIWGPKIKAAEKWQAWAKVMMRRMSEKK